jgi:uncharacterized protein (DUF58 family)
MQTLIPQSVSHEAHPKGRLLGRALGYGLTPRTLLLLCGALLLAIPAFRHAKTPWLMFGVDALILAAAISDVIALPAPELFTVTRRFVHAPELGRPVEMELTVVQTAHAMYTVLLTDDLHPSLVSMPRAVKLVSYPNDPANVRAFATPSLRGDLPLGKVYLRYRSVLGFVERWAVADVSQTVRVYAAGEAAGASQELFLMRARQIELEKRRLRRIGLGREFETMRDYQPGDELRNISWTSTARMNKLITQQFTTERSQQVWVVLDAGRLSRTAFTLGGSDAGSSKALDRFDDAVATETRVVTQLDQAAAAAGMLARVVNQSGDKCALLTYGRGVQQQLLPGAGALHLRRFVDALAQVRSETAEADHMLASMRLRQLQRRRGLVLWITEMTETAGRPEIVAAVSSLVRRHLVVLVLLQHPELEAMADSSPSNARAMYAATAAQEMLERRRITLAQLRAQGVLVVETTASHVAADAISKYLEVKAKGRL